MADAEMLCQKAILRLHHVVIVILRETRAQSIGGFRRFARPDGVRKNDEVGGGVERLARSEKFAAEIRAQKCTAGAVSGMEKQNRLAAARSHRGVVKAHLRQCFAGVKAEV